MSVRARCRGVAEPKAELKLAEGVGFEPTLGLLLGLISSQVPSTTQPPFHISKRLESISFPGGFKSHGGIAISGSLAKISRCFSPPLPSAFGFFSFCWPQQRRRSPLERPTSRAGKFPTG